MPEQAQTRAVTWEIAPKMPYGPYCRLENSRSQTKFDTQKQVMSGEIWGAAARNIYQSDLPCVKAFRRGLLPGEAGIEFVTDVAPTIGSGSNIEVRWYANEPGVRILRDNGTDYAVINVTIIKTQP